MTTDHHLNDSNVSTIRTISDNEGNPPNVQTNSDDDADSKNDAAVDSDSEMVDDQQEPEDPYAAAMDTLEERLVSTLDAFKLSSGGGGSGGKDNSSYREILAPALEIAAHIGPLTARQHHNPPQQQQQQQQPNQDLRSIDQAIEETYVRLNEHILLPTLLEIAQSDVSVSKRGAALECLRSLYKECCKPGSYLDKTLGLVCGPTHDPSLLSSTAAAQHAHHGHASSAVGGGLVMTDRRLLQARIRIKAAREKALLICWLKAGLGCTSVYGAFSNAASDDAAVSRGVLAGSSALRPAMKCIARSIKDADDTGANELFMPVMKMVDGVVNRLFLVGGLALSDDMGGSNVENSGSDGVRSACVKFMEILILCFTSKGPSRVIQGKRRNEKTEDSFSLEDLPTGHPTITHETLESLGEFSFTALRGLVEVGGQIKIDTTLLPEGTIESIFSGGMMGGLYDDMDVMGNSNSDNKPLSKYAAIVKAAALAFLEIESSIRLDADSKDDKDSSGSGTSSNNKENISKIRDNLELDFHLSQKSYSVAINALSIIAINRPECLKAVCTTLAQRAMDPPKPLYSATSEDNKASGGSGGGGFAILTKATALGISNNLRASCVSLLRNPLSYTVGGWETLYRALEEVGMNVQAKKALEKAKEQAFLKTASRAARNRAAVFYEWDFRQTKRQRVMDNALAEMRAEKIARGLGGGIQLPHDMVTACELVLINLKNLPDGGRPGGGVGSNNASANASKKKREVTLDLVVDAVMSNGASLSVDESKWYERDGGAAWNMWLDVSARRKDAHMEESMGEGEDIAATTARYSLDSKTIEAARGSISGCIAKQTGKNTKKNDDNNKENTKTDLFRLQCQGAASDAFGRIIQSLTKSRLSASSAGSASSSFGELGNQVAARLAWTLKGIAPPKNNDGSEQLQEAFSFAEESVQVLERASSKSSENTDGKNGKTSTNFAKGHPLVSSCLALEFTMSSYNPSSSSENTSSPSFVGGSSSSPIPPSGSLANRILFEAYLGSCEKEKHHEQHHVTTNEHLLDDYYKNSVELLASSISHSCERANNVPNDQERKRIATHAASTLPHYLAVIPSLTERTLHVLATTLCDIEKVSKIAVEAKKMGSGAGSQNTFASAASAHNAAHNAEKRATVVLLRLRDAAFQRSATGKYSARRCAVNLAVGIAAGRIQSTVKIQENALKLVMNVLFPKSLDLANKVVSSATEELIRAADFAIGSHNMIQEANAAALAENDDAIVATRSNSLQPISNVEKNVLASVRKPAVLFMALCVRRPEMIRALLKESCREGADALSKAVRTNMPKFARSAATKYGAAIISLKVADMADGKETSLLLAFLDNVSMKDQLPSKELVDACFQIQSKKFGETGKKDPRFIIPVVSGMNRDMLVEKLPEFVESEPVVYKAALARMSERIERQKLIFREGGDADNIISGMTLCEQLVFLHQLKFKDVGLTQRQYLDAIRICLDEDEIFTDQIIMSALDYMSGKFLIGEEGLPLAYMRTTILTCTKHESLRPWICEVLLPRLIEARVFTDRRQWEGWMRCASMLEEEPKSSIQAILNLPEEQLRIYRSRYSDTAATAV